MAEDIARAFAPFAVIEEYENITAVHRKQGIPPFLCRNLSYTALHTERAERDAHTNIIVKLHLELMPNSKFQSLTAVASVCSVLHDTQGTSNYPIMVPLAARIFTIPDSRNTDSCVGSGNIPGTVTITIPMNLPRGVFPRDCILVILQQQDVAYSHMVGHILRANHRGIDWSGKDRGVTCTIKGDRVFHWFRSGSSVLYAAIHPSEEMTAKVSGIASRKGTVELQPGVLNTTPVLNINNNNNNNNNHGSMSTFTTHHPPGFSIAFAPMKEAPPMLRYAMSIAPSHTYNSIRRMRGTLIDQYIANARLEQNNNITNRTGHPFPPPLAVNFCSNDGSHKITSKIHRSYICPFESCGIECRGTITAFMHHLSACHPYFEYFVTTHPLTGDGEGAGSESLPEIWARCKRYWFHKNGFFLPLLTNPNAIPVTHPLYALLYQSPQKLPFLYQCSPYDRSLRFIDGSTTPEDPQEVKLEHTAELRAEDAWKDARLLPDGNNAGRVLLDGGGPGLLHDNTVNNKGGRGFVRRVSRNSTSLHSAQSTSRMRRHLNQEQQGMGNSNDGSGNLLNQKIRLPLITADRRTKYYHSKTLIAIQENEMEEPYDSDDDDDTEQYIRYCRNTLEERKNVCAEEIEFMLAWNRCVHKHPIHADFQMSEACTRFAIENKEMLTRDPAGPFRRCFVAHVHTMWRFRLLTPSQMHEALMAASPDANM